MTKQAVFFVNVWPEPKSSAAGIRTVELTQFLTKLGYDVTGVGPAAASQHSDAWGIRTITCDPNSTEDADKLKTLTPELIVFDRFYTEEKYGWRAREFWPDALQMIDTIDIHSLRTARQRAQAANEDSHEPPSQFFEDDFLREMASLHRADVSLVVSKHEEEWLANKGFERDRILFLPFSTNAEPNPPKQSDRKGYAFIGNYMHAPNVDAVKWLEKELWPALRAKDPKAELHLYGAYPPQAITQLNGKNGITVHGFVEDHRAAISQHEVMLAPLRFGAGIKGKVLEAWGTGTPVLGTAIAFESMGSGFAEFTDAKSFVDQIQKLEDPTYWSEQVTKGHDVIARDFDQETIFKKFAEFLEHSKKSLPKFRSSLTGRLLRHHGSQSQKYFSKWIEEKNKR